jgi:preprotein translocase subunit YajC
VLQNAFYTVVNSIVLAQTEAPASEGTEGPPGFGMWLPLIAIVAIMYFLLFRPQQKREKERRSMLDSLAKGDRVMTNGGMMGTIVGLNDKTMVLRVSEEPLVKLEFVRAAVARKLAEGEEPDEDNA